MEFRYDDRHEIADLSRGELARLVGVLDRCRTILGNMALENDRALLSLRPRWQISDKPLRVDAKGLLPEIDELLRVHIKSEDKNHD